MSTEARGRWVRRGMVWVQLGPRPADEPDPEHVITGCVTNSCEQCGGAVSRRETKRCLACVTKGRKSNVTPTCPDCGSVMSRRASRCSPCRQRYDEDGALTDLMDRFAASFARITDPWTGVNCDDCGCLCRSGEDCPGCLAWAVTDERRWNQRHTYRERRAA